MSDELRPEDINRIKNLVFTDCMDRKPMLPPGLHILPWVCACCDGKGRWESGERCQECIGFGLVAERPSDVWGTRIRRAPRPPAVASKMCRDCAYRPGAPETDDPPPADRPFFCHHGCAPTEDGYTAAVSYAGLPIGERVCAGWWWTVTGDGDNPATAEAFVDTHPHSRNEATG